MPSKLPNRYLLLYGSQTGQAKGIAEEICERSSQHGLYADIHCMSQLDKKFGLEKEHVAVIVTSTTGEGDPPDTALKFVRRFGRKTLPSDHLINTHYTVLGLGDTNYSSFCANSKNIDRRLSELGAKRFYPSGFADEAVGLEVVADPWIDGLFVALREFLGVSTPVETDMESPSVIKGIGSVHQDSNPNQTINPELSDQSLASVLESTKLALLVGDAECTSNQVASRVDALQSSLESVPSAIESYTGLSVLNSASICESCFSNGTSAGYNNTQNDKPNTNRENSGEFGGLSEGDFVGTSDAVVDGDKVNSASNLDINYISVANGITAANRNNSSIRTVSESNSTQMMAQDSVTQLGHNQANLLFHLGCETSSLDSSTSSSLNNPALLCSGEISGVVQESNYLKLNKPSTEGPSLGISVPPLSEAKLTVPVAVPEYLTITFLPEDKDLPGKMATLPWQNGCKGPSAGSDIITVKVENATCLTSPDALKKTLLLSLNTQGCDFTYRPGDSISVICYNYVDEVNQLIARLDVMADTRKKRASIPSHIPPEGVSVRYILRTCVDIREPPKKAMLRMLADYTSSKTEQRRLLELCSKEGSEDYSAHIRAENVCLLDVLYTFVTCQPPIEKLLEHLPRLQPRPYSICSCMDWSPGCMDIAFSVVHIPSSSSRLFNRQGLCSGWLDDLTLLLQIGNKRNSPDDEVKNLADQIQSMSVSSIEIQVFARTTHNFRPQFDLSIPQIMVGPGTGVAPFIGFLQERQFLMDKIKSETTVGQCWLFFGCRNENKDFLFRSTMEDFQSRGVLTKLLVSFSRDENIGSTRYVQDNISMHAVELNVLLLGKAVIYVCGDAANMAKDVNAAFEEVLVKEQGLSPEEAKMHLMKMRINRQYLEDVWT